MAAARVLKNVSTLFLRSTTIGVSALAFHQYVAGFIVCRGPSMLPSVVTHDILLTDHISPRFGNIRRGDIVIARDPVKPGLICKRVVALAGDTVNFNGRAVNIPDSHVWLEGDNKNNSTDSRDYGYVPMSNVERRCFCKIWPTLDYDFGKRIPFYAAAGANQVQSDG